jgi:hypothetical protein
MGLGVHKVKSVKVVQACVRNAQYFAGMERSRQGIRAARAAGHTATEEEVAFVQRLQ